MANRKYSRIRQATITVTNEDCFVLLTLVHPATGQTITTRTEAKDFKDGQRIISDYKKLYPLERR